MARRTQRVGVYGLILRGEDVLLVRAGSRSATPRRWYLPGGGIEFGENVVDALARETREETGLDIEVRGVVAVLSDVTDNKSADVQTHTVRLVFEAHIIGGFLCEETEGSSDRAEWHPVGGLPTEVMPFVAEALRELRRSIT